MKFNISKRDKIITKISKLLTKLAAMTPEEAFPTYEEYLERIEREKAQSQETPNLDVSSEEEVEPAGENLGDEAFDEVADTIRSSYLFKGLLTMDGPRVEGDGFYFKATKGPDTIFEMFIANPENELYNFTLDVYDDDAILDGLGFSWGVNVDEEEMRSINDKKDADGMHSMVYRTLQGILSSQHLEGLTKDELLNKRDKFEENFHYNEKMLDSGYSPGLLGPTQIDLKKRIALVNKKIGRL